MFHRIGSRADSREYDAVSAGDDGMIFSDVGLDTDSLKRVHHAC
jgi:hypothetical protein